MTYYVSPRMWAHMEDVCEVMGGWDASPYPWSHRLTPGLAWVDLQTGWGRRILSLENDRVQYETLPDGERRDSSVNTFLRWQDKYSGRLTFMDEGVVASKGQMKLPFGKEAP